MRPAPDARVVDYPESTVVYDPVAGVVRVLGGDSRLIVQFLGAQIAQGVSGRDDLLDLLLDDLQRGDSPADQTEATDDMMRSRLGAWVDLARHLYL